MKEEILSKGVLTEEKKDMTIREEKDVLTEIP